MLKPLRILCALPVFPAILVFGAWILGLPCVKILLLGLLAVGATALCIVLLYPRRELPIPKNWKQDLRQLQRKIEKIKNKSVYRSGHEILTELKQCQTNFPFLTPSARREITEYYLPTFARYFTAYATFEEFNEGNTSILETMQQMEISLKQIAESFRKVCDRNDRTAALNIHAETAVLSKKLNARENLYG